MKKIVYSLLFASIFFTTEANTGPIGGSGGGGGGTPGGSNTQVQYNNAGAFGGITGATTNGTALTLTAPDLGTPASATLTNATGLPLSTGITGFGTGVATALATPTLANWNAALSNADFAILGANTFTATQTITPAANTNALSSTGYSLTGSNAQSLIDLSGTWNTTGTPTAIKSNITDTASNSASLLMDLQVGGVSQFSVRKDGRLQTGISFSPSIDWGVASQGLLTIGRIDNSNSYVSLGFAGVSGRVQLNSGGFFGWTSSSTSTTAASADTFIHRDGVAAIIQVGQDSATAVHQTLKACDGSGTNEDGCSLTVASGRSTGNIEGPVLNFQTAPAGSSGTSENALVTRASFLGKGHFRLEELSADPTTSDLSANGQGAVYFKNNKLVFAWNLAGTINYLTIPMDGATTAFGWSTTAP